MRRFIEDATSAIVVLGFVSVMVTWSAAFVG